MLEKTTPRDTKTINQAWMSENLAPVRADA